MFFSFYMVKGIDQFKAYFAGFADRYFLIGGAACYLAMEEAGLEFRVTKDLDIVLCVEALDAEFVDAFWEFVKKGDLLISNLESIHAASR